MSGLLSGLGSFGLEGLEDMELFEEEKKQEKTVEAEKAQKPEVKEEEYLFDKTFQCPVCDKKVTARTIRTGKVRLIGADPDMRPRYEQTDPLKYDVIMCDRCGFTALTRFFTYMTPTQKKAIKEKISQNFKAPEVKATYTYEEALERYKMALACSIIKGAKASEKAYICLKMGWLCRSYGESLDKKTPGYADMKKEIDEMENAFLHNALDGFVAAVASESFPICGMDEVTVDYLMATLAARFGKYDVASKLISSVLSSHSANSRMKDRARDLKEQVLLKIREQGE